MAAITDAARRGVSIANTTMYVTTFPCHLCAPHIVAAGVRRVVYIEPYAKSLAVQLYPDSISVGAQDSNLGQVKFEPFVGVAPRMYMDLFTMTKRKRDGKVIQFDRKVATPRYPGSPRAYIANEIAAMGKLGKILQSEQLKIEQQEFNYDESRSF